MLRNPPPPKRGSPPECHSPPPLLQLPLLLHVAPGGHSLWGEIGGGGLSVLRRVRVIWGGSHVPPQPTFLRSAAASSSSSSSSSTYLLWGKQEDQSLPGGGLSPGHASPKNKAPPPPQNRVPSSPLLLQHHLPLIILQVHRLRRAPFILLLLLPGIAPRRRVCGQREQGLGTPSPFWGPPPKGFSGREMPHQYLAGCRRWCPAGRFGGPGSSAAPGCGRNPAPGGGRGPGGGHGTPRSLGGGPRGPGGVTQVSGG